MRPHGIMFHHFHSARHPAGQGSISAEQLGQIIERIGPRRILPARQWMRCAMTATLRPTDVCLTFDDNLRCQYDVALPVLEAYGLTAFWFVYTSVCQGNIERLEVYRYFRTTCFDSVDAFYDAFFAAVDDSAHGATVRDALQPFKPREYLKAYPFYTDADRRFRFVRDEVLGPEAYARVMDAMLARAELDVSALARQLWMGNSELKELHGKGHVIGLHSHTHPTRIERLPVEAQRDEYQQNFDCLHGLLGDRPEAMSHPCNSYTRDTLTILRELGISLGFAANMQVRGQSELEYPREDHANLVRSAAA
ncbi:MAG TPA: polysaccharide deacetylase family protein [Tepidisphaeraceae bacterium]|jgi:peptidoglycan/xylan/chitin deacetylase (PgdA/CDA1 family)